MSRRKTNNKEYKWRSGHSFKVEAKIAAEELQRIQEAHGKLEPQTIVDEARSKNSPIHDAFEWDNNVAGDKYRLQQARLMARSIIVEFADSPDLTPRHIFVHVPATEGEKGYYQDVEVAIQNPDEAERALARLAGKVQSAEQSFVEFSDLYKGRGKRKVQRVGKLLREARSAVDDLAAAA